MERLGFRESMQVQYLFDYKACTTAVLQISGVVSTFGLAWLAIPLGAKLSLVHSNNKTYDESLPSSQHMSYSVSECSLEMTQDISLQTFRSSVRCH